MAIFTVHMKPAQIGIEDRSKPALDAVFLKDGFSWAAFLFAPLWLLLNRLWFGFVIYLGVVALLSLLAGWLHIPPPALSAIMLLVNLALGFEARNLQRDRLARKGFSTINVVQGTKLDDAERRFFASWKDETVLQRPFPQRDLPEAGQPRAAKDDIVGLFPEKGGYQ